MRDLWNGSSPNDSIATFHATDSPERSFRRKRPTDRAFISWSLFITQLFNRARNSIPSSLPSPTAIAPRMLPDVFTFPFSYFFWLPRPVIAARRYVTCSFSSCFLRPPLKLRRWLPNAVIITNTRYVTHVCVPFKAVSEQVKAEDQKKMSTGSCGFDLAGLSVTQTKEICWSQNFFYFLEIC